MHRITRFLPLLPLAALMACGDDAAPTDPFAGGDSGPAMAISDATHLPGRDGFHFLPPMVSAPSFSGTFDPGLSPEVRVCVLPACTTVIKTFNSASTGAEKLTVDLSGESYNALWNTKNNPNNLALGADRYRLEVWVGPARLGYADLWFVSNAKGLKAVTSDYVGVVRGSTLTIKFRVETGVIGAIAVVADPAHIVGSGTSTVMATVTDLYGDPVSGATVDWESSDTDVATVSPSSSITDGSGQATTTASTATEGGETTITARSGGVEGSTVLEVTLNAPPVAEDDEYSVQAGQTLSAPDAGPPVVPGILENDFLGVPPVLVVSSIDIGTGSLAIPQSNLAFAGGQLSVNSDGSFTLVGPTQADEHTFSYTMDNGIGSSTATVTITVTPGAAAKLGIVTQPSANATSGAAFAQQPVIRVEDAFGNPVATAGIDVTASIASGTGTVGGDNVVATDVDGLATFEDLSITGAAGGYTLSFDAPSLTGVVSNTITLGAGAEEKLAFIVQPSNTQAAQTITPAVQVAIQDGGGNTVNSTASVTLAIGTNPAGGALSGTVTVAAVAGIATFGDLSIDKAGTGYTLVASSAGLTDATSNGFDITAGALASFRVEAAGGGDIGTQQVGAAFSIDITALDAGDNVVTSFAGTVDISAAGASLSAGGGTTAAFTAGTLNHSVTFGTAGAAVTITATRTGGAETGTSNEFVVQGPPDAVDDTDATVTGGTSSPGSTIYHIGFEATSNGVINVLANDNLGVPPAHTMTFGNVQLNGGSAIGGAVTDNAFGAAVNLGSNGSLAVEADGDVNLTAPDGFTGLITFDYQLTNDAGSDQATVTIAVGERPVAANDTYGATLVGNISINTATGTPFSVTTNDDGDGVTLAIVGGSATNGEAVLNADGTFTFNPTAGFRNGNGSFQYTLANGFGTSLPATVTIPVGTQVVWFVDNGATACTTLADGCGRLSNPFSTLAALQAINNGTGNNPADNHHIFVHQSATGYTGGLTLRSGQRLIGQDATSTLLALTGVTLPSHSPTLPTMNSGDATMTAFTGAAGGIALNSGNRLHGFTASPSTGAGVSGTSVGSLFVRDVGVNTASGPAVDLANGTVDVIFTGVSSSASATRNVNLDAISGSVNLASGALAGSTGEALRINGGTADVSYSGSISNAAGRSVSISGKTGGTVTLSGSIGDTGAGIDVTGNTGATINFSGALTVSTGASPAFSATGGGTVAATNATSTLATTTATALRIENTTIGAGGLVFRSIAAGTAASGPANGIVLNNTGALGGLTVSGTGGAGTGGTLQRTTGDAISLTSTAKISLASMNVLNNLGSGIRGSTVNGFVLTGSTISGNGDSAANDESGIFIENLTGSAAGGANPTSITGNTISNNFEFEINIVNNAGATTLTNLVMSGNAISANGLQLNHGNLMNFLAVGTGPHNMTLNLTSGSFTGNTDISGGKIVTGTGLQCDHSGSSGTVTCNVSGATFTNNNVGPQASVAVGGAAVIDFNGNTITGTRSHGINLFADANAPFTKSISGRIRNNVIGSAGVANSGSQLGPGIRVQNEGSVPITLLIENNTVQQTQSFQGINVNVGISIGALLGGAATNLTIVGNSFNNIGSRAIAVQDNDASTGAKPTVCVDMRQNFFGANIAGQAGDGSWVRLRRLSGTFNVRQAQPTIAVNAAELDDQQANGNDATGTKYSISGVLQFSQPACAQP